MDCVFCKIINNEIPSYKIYETDKVFAFLDINPVNPGHTLVIPKKHVDYIFDIPDKEYSNLFLEAKKISKVLKKITKAKRIGIIVEGFAVHHTHIHLVPLYIGGELCLSLGKPATEKELKEMQAKILKEL